MRGIVTVLCLFLLICFMPIGCQPRPEKKACAGEIYQVLPTGAMLEPAVFVEVSTSKTTVPATCGPVVAKTPCCAVAVHRHPVLRVAKGAVKGAARVGGVVVRVATAPVRILIRR